MPENAGNDIRGPFCCAGFRFWKRPWAAAFLAAPGEPAPEFYPTLEEAAEAAGRKGGSVALWASSAPADAREICARAGAGTVFMEDGFLRSAGLGVNFYEPWSLVLDTEGFHCDPSRPSRLECILNGMPERQDREALKERARELQRLICRLGVSKYESGTQGDLELPVGRRIVLVPGQAEDDASVRLGCRDVRTNLDLLCAARKAEPDAFIVWKPHPDVEAGLRKGVVPDWEALMTADVIARNCSMDWLLKRTDCVCTMTSLAGFEAILRGVPTVRCFGAPFYAGWGLTEDAVPVPRRTARLDAEELIAGALLLYPRYYDWERGCLSDAEDVCVRLSERAAGRGRPTKLGQAGFLPGVCARVHAAVKRLERKIFGKSHKYHHVGAMRKEGG